MSNNIAIAHDEFRTVGGAERVAFELARAFDAPIFAGRIDDGVVPEDVTAHELFSSHRITQLYAYRTPFPLRSLAKLALWKHVKTLAEYDVVIANKSTPAWYVPHDEQTMVRYVHSPARWCHDQWYTRDRGLIERGYAHIVQMLYETRYSYPKAVVANSEVVKERIKTYEERAQEVEVIYPPVDVDSFSPAKGTVDGGFYLTVSRLQDHKRIDEIIRAINQLNNTGEYRLVVCGDGPEREDLEKLAGENIEFRGYVDEEEKRQLMAEAKAFIMAAETEDFGMTPIESFASGTPVIGVKEGMTKHQIKHGENGYVYSRQGGHLRETIRLFEREGVSWTPERIEAYADQFSTDRFATQMRAVVDRVVDDESVEVDIAIPEVAK